LLAVNTAMTTRIRVTTQFDCTATGVTGHFRANALPFDDREGQKIHDQTAWNRSRNQQRNWETILQIIGLYTQAQDISTTEKTSQGWCFEFSTEFDDVFSDRGDSLGLLKLACQGVPMFDDLDRLPRTAMLEPGKNIEFAIVDHK
jgi:hypothetical protein